MESTTSDGITESEVAATYKVLETLRENLSNDGMENLSEICNEAHYLVQQYDEGANWKTHKFDVGDYALDRREPTPSPEANTVKIVELLDERANECFIEETEKFVSEHKHNRGYPETDPVVVGVYPNMSSDKEWHFPESRLQKV